MEVVKKEPAVLYRPTPVELEYIGAAVADLQQAQAMAAEKERYAKRLVSLIARQQGLPDTVSFVAERGEFVAPE